MRYVSTRGASPRVGLRTALLTGLAPDGGLYMPERLPQLDPALLDDLRSRTLAEIGDEICRPFVDALSDGERARLVQRTLDFEIPLVELGDGVWVLELFHGPTLAFKDVGARFMARLMARWAGDDPRGPLTVITATSGDTGGAVAQAFAGLEGVRVAVLYPQGKVSPLQEKQFTTLGGNVQALAVDGDFDDCQRLAKEAFRDEALRGEVRLTSANSINIGRLLPQMFYYFQAVARLPEGAGPPLFSTPSGNFGNLTAGLMARQTGLPTSGFVAATNVNDAVPRYLLSGRYEPEAARATLSNAMDVGDPSNFERMRWLYGDDVDRMRRMIAGSRHDDRSTVRTMRRVHEERGYLLDPHTAVGYLGLRERLAQLPEPAPGVLLATAHPAKFRDQIEPLLGFEVEIPERLRRCLELESRAVGIPPRSSALAAFLRGWD